MRGLAYHERPRSLGAQRARMMARWPQFQFNQLQGTMVSWEGPIRGFQKQHRIEIFWDPAGLEKPYVVLRNPELKPREGRPYEEIPHLLFYSDRPELSGLCLFDPEGEEWSKKLLIANTTVVWAGEWLLYYELWHVDGIWRGGGVGAENIAESRAAAVYRETDKLAKDSPGAIGLAP